MALQIRHKKSGYDYAFELEVFDSQEDTAEETAKPLISEEQAMTIASDYWGIQTGDVSPDRGFVFRIDCRQTVATTSRGEAVYVVCLRWLVDGDHYSTVDVLWVNAETGEVMTPYG